MIQNNKISICVPVYNRPDLTIKALESILWQTIKPFEVVVLDDNSPEDMKKVEEYCQINGFIYQKNRNNLGLINNINETILNTKGDFWCVLHNDDMLSPFYVEECLRFLQEYPEFDIWATNGCAINSNNAVIAEFRLFNKDFTIKKKKGLESLYKNGYYSFLSIIGSTIYRTSFIKNHLFNITWGNEADLDSALYFFANYDIKYIDTTIYFTRLHNGQESKKNKRTSKELAKYINNRILIYEKYSNIFLFNNFLIPIYSIHLLQLVIKYKLSYRESLMLLKVSKIKDLLLMICYIPTLLIHTLKHKILFIVHKNEIKKYLIL